MKRITKLAILGAAVAYAATKIAKRSAFSFAGRSVLITGGSRGLGLLIARQLAAEGARLTLVGRDLRPLEAAESELRGMGAAVRILECDVRDRRQAEEAVEETVREYGAIDVLINNAGVIQVGPLEHLTLEDFENAMATHAWGPLYTTLAAISHMRKRGEGRIVNISSIGGKIAVPHMMPYCMSKFALAGLSDSMALELGSSGIYVTSVYPGLMRTGSHVNAEFKGQHREEFTWFSLMAALPMFSINGRRAAHQIVEACRAGRPELIITAQARAAVIAKAVFPNLMVRVMRIMNALLPGPASVPSAQSRSGWVSKSKWSPSVLTHLADRVIEENNEHRAAS